MNQVYSIFAIETCKHHLSLALFADINYVKLNFSDKYGVCNGCKWISSLIFDTCSAAWTTGKQQPEDFGRDLFCRSCKKFLCLRTASTSWYPAVLKFPLAQTIYHLTTSHLQLSAALLSYSCCRPAVNGKSYLVQIASQYCED